MILETALVYKVLYWHLIPSASAVILTAGFIGLAIKTLGLKSPRWQYWLFLVPLAKGFVVLVNGVRPWPAIPTSKPFVFGIRLWDPLNLITVPSAFDSLPRVLTAVDQMVIGAVALLLLALVWRWVSLFFFYRSLAGEELHPEDAPRVFLTLDSLVKKMRTPYPQVAVSDKSFVLPCLIGVFKPTIVLSPQIAEESSDDVLEAMLAHELAHLKRRDNLFHWASVALKDLLVVNPFTYVIFPKILAAKEQDCDHIAAEVTGNSKAVAEAIVYAATAANERGMKALPGNMSEVVESFFAGRLVTGRIDRLLNTGTTGVKVSRAKGSAAVFFALFSLFIHIPFSLPPPLVSPMLQF